MRKSKQHGFTLIEMLVVVALIALIAPAAYSMLNSTILVNKHVKDTNRSATSLAVFMDWLEDDLKQIIMKKAQLQDKELAPALVLTGDKLSFTRTGWANPMGKRRSQLQRVEYRLPGSGVERVHWARSNDANESNEVVQSFGSVSLSNIEVMSTTGDWHSAWPTGSTKESPQPIALRVKVTTESGSVMRFFEINSAPLTLKEGGQ